jgi:DNA-binding transcriptional MerR regulator
MEKKQIEKTILQRAKSCSNFRDNRFTWGEIKDILEKENITLQDNDILEVGFTEGWQEGDSARDNMYDLKIKRVREETDEEFEKRKQKIVDLQERSKKNRLETYLKLKEEFE